MIFELIVLLYQISPEEAKGEAACILDKIDAFRAEMFLSER